MYPAAAHFISSQRQNPANYRWRRAESDDWRTSSTYVNLLLVKCWHVFDSDWRPPIRFDADIDIEQGRLREFQDMESLLDALHREEGHSPD